MALKALIECGAIEKAKEIIDYMADAGALAVKNETMERDDKDGV